MKKTYTAILMVIFAGCFGEKPPAGTNENISTTQDICTKAPPEYQGSVKKGGEPCLYHNDCASSFCLPIGNGDAVCTKKAAENKTCASIGDNWVATLHYICDKSQVYTICAPTTCTSNCNKSDVPLNNGSACFSNDECKSYCFLGQNKETGVCVSPNNKCPANHEIKPIGNAGTDPVFVCIPI